MTFVPRRWWTGTLDVERLAWDAVSRLRHATQALAHARNISVSVGTSPALVAGSFAAIDHLRINGEAGSPWAPISGFFPVADGWVRLHANYPHHAAAISRVFGVATRAELAEALLEWPALAVEEAVTQQRGIAVAVRTRAQWQDHPHGRASAGTPWVHVERGDARPIPTAGTSVLSGIRVLDFTRVIAGPSCSQALACLGADVLRVDPPDRPELLDHHLSTGMGKRSIELDLRSAPALVEGLLDNADVVLLGYRPGSLDRYGLHPDALLRRHPHLIVASLSAWGESGPWARRPGFDSIVQAASGIAAHCGDGERPGALPVQALDHATGAVMAAEVMQLLAQARAGIVRLSLLGAAQTLLALPAPPDHPVHRWEPQLVQIASAHGMLTLTPPPLTLDGATIEAPISAYGRGQARWLTE